MLVKWLVLQDNLAKPVSECQTILGFTAARYDGSGSGAYRSSRTCCHL